MQNTMVRFSRDEIYTFVGSVLLAINPYKLIGSLYGEDVMATFETTSLVDAPPHVYAVVENCFRRAIHGSGSQSLIIGGESGAGKTESTKLALSYLVWRTRRQAKADGSAYAGFMACILQANPLMEAFGNVMAHCALDMDVHMRMYSVHVHVHVHAHVHVHVHVHNMHISHVHVHMYTCSTCSHVHMYMLHVHVHVTCACGSQQLHDSFAAAARSVLLLMLPQPGRPAFSVCLCPPFSCAATPVVGMHFAQSQLVALRQVHSPRPQRRDRPAAWRAGPHVPS